MPKLLTPRSGSILLCWEPAHGRRRMRRRAFGSKLAHSSLPQLQCFRKLDSTVTRLRGTRSGARSTERSADGFCPRLNQRVLPPPWKSLPFLPCPGHVVQEEGSHEILVASTGDRWTSETHPTTAAIRRYSQNVTPVFHRLLIPEPIACSSHTGRGMLQATRAAEMDCPHWNKHGVVGRSGATASQTSCAHKLQGG